MGRSRSVVSVVLVVALLAAPPLAAHTVRKEITWRLGTGYSQPLGSTGDVAGGGWNIHTGVDWHPRRSQFGVNGRGSTSGRGAATSASRAASTR